MSSPYIAPDVVAILGDNGYTPITNADIDVPSISSLEIGLDVSAQMNAIETFGAELYLAYGIAIDSITEPTNYTVVLEDASGTVIPLGTEEVPNLPTLNFYKIVQLVPGSLLTPGNGYTLTFRWSDQSGNGYRVGVIKLHCPF